MNQILYVLFSFTTAANRVPHDGADRGENLCKTDKRQTEAEPKHPANVCYQGGQGHHLEKVASVKFAPVQLVTVQ